jgi:hypothetical protein
MGMVFELNFVSFPILYFNNSSMAIPAPLTMDLSSSVLASELGRQRLVASVLSFTENTSLTPSTLERELLGRFVQGELTIDEVVARLEDEV